MLTQEEALGIWKSFDEAGLRCSLHVACLLGGVRGYNLTSNLAGLDASGLKTVSGLVEHLPEDAEVKIDGGYLEIS